MRCPRCNGNIVRDRDGAVCLQCGRDPAPVAADDSPAPNHHKWDPKPKPSKFGLTTEEQHRGNHGRTRSHVL